MTWHVFTVDFLLWIYYESTHFLHLGNVRSMTWHVLTCMEVITAETWVIAVGKAIRDGVRFDPVFRSGS